MQQNQAHYKFMGLTVLCYSGLVLLWHCLNGALPTSDAVAYLSDAYRVYSNGEGVVSLLHNMYFERGWRPQIFPVFAVPFLVMSGGNPLFAVGATSFIFSVIFITYLYRILRLELSPVNAALAALMIGSTEYMFHYNLVFFSELAYSAFFVGFLYHLLKSDAFSQPRHALYAGLWIGLALCVRPAEALLLSCPILCLLFMGVRRRHVTFNDIWMGVNICLGTVLVMFYITYVFGYTKVMLVPTALFAIAAFAYMRRCVQKNRNTFLVFILALNTVLFVYWLPSIPALVNWSIEASVGDVVKSLGLQKAPVSTLAFEVFNAWKSLLIPLMVLIPLAIVFHSRRESLRSLSSPLSLALMAMIAFTALMFTMIVNDGQVVRRTIVIMVLLGVFLLNYLLSSRRPYKKLAQCVIALLVTVNVGVLLLDTLAIAQPKAVTRLREHGILTAATLAPTRIAEDKHITMLKIMAERAERYGIKNKNINMQLIDGPPGYDYWDPFTTGLANAIVKPPFWVGFMFVKQDEDSYEVMKQRKVHFVLIDAGEHLSEKYLDSTNAVYSRFCASVIREYRKGKFTRLQLVDVMEVNGHKMLLLKFPDTEGML